MQKMELMMEKLYKETDADCWAGPCSEGPFSLSLGFGADPGTTLLGKVQSKGREPPPAPGVEKKPWGL